MAENDQSAVPTFKAAAKNIDLVAKRLVPVANAADKIITVGEKAIKEIVSANQAVAAQVRAGQDTGFVDTNEKKLAVANDKALSNINKNISSLWNKFFINLGGDLIQDADKVVKDLTTRLSEGTDRLFDDGISSGIAGVFHGTDEQRLTGLKEDQEKLIKEYSDLAEQAKTAPAYRTSAGGDITARQLSIVEELKELGPTIAGYQAAVDMQREIEEQKLEQEKKNETLLSDPLNDISEIEHDNNTILKEIADGFESIKSICECHSSSNSNTAEINGTRANGGPVSAGSTYLVGEKGPEVFIPSSNGTIIPNRTSNSAVVILNNLRELGVIADKIFGDLEQKAQSWANTFVDSVLLGQQTFKGFIASILDDLAKVALQQAVSPIKSFLGNALGTVFGSLFGGGGTAAATAGASFGYNSANQLPGFGIFGALPKASGGPVMSGLPHIVGEHGPELFMPSSNGKIIPNHRLNGRGAGGNVISVNANVNINGGNVGRDGADPQTAKAVQRQFENMAKQAFQAQLRQEMRPGGMLTAGV